MSDLHDHSPGGDLVFPGELSGTTFRLHSTQLYTFEDGEPQNGIPAEIKGEPRYGKWIHVATEQDEHVLMAAPGELIRELQIAEAEMGDVFEVTRCEKSGPEQSDQYEVNLEEREKEQDRL